MIHFIRNNNQVIFRNFVAMTPVILCIMRRIFSLNAVHGYISLGVFMSR
ncbi:unknown protein [Cronobacter turicensis z3032]|uniref:Uncharacterized protein n=1 Tax=Cronobacter turicensis (strain DSM 18703 / CCUG 55852 / LMG 23827 / z3032) TaxID=693216 RepID=C9XUN1_CROTZ|nr:unknown protein [Cronobacter turicensis z3032]